MVRTNWRFVLLPSTARRSLLHIGFQVGPYQNLNSTSLPSSLTMRQEKTKPCSGNTWKLVNKVPLVGIHLDPRLTKLTMSASVFLPFAIQNCMLLIPLKKEKLMFVSTRSRGVFINSFNTGETTESKAKKGEDPLVPTDVVSATSFDSQQKANQIRIGNQCCSVNNWPLATGDRRWLGQWDAGA